MLASSFSVSLPVYIIIIIQGNFNLLSVSWEMNVMSQSLQWDKGFFKLYGSNGNSLIGASMDGMGVSGKFVLIHSCSWYAIFIYFQDQIDAAVKTLLALKADYKSATGQDWKPGTAPAPAPKAAPAPVGDAAAIHEKIVGQGNTVRELKGQKAPKVINSEYISNG